MSDLDRQTAEADRVKLEQQLQDQINKNQQQMDTNQQQTQQQISDAMNQLLKP